MGLRYLVLLVFVSLLFGVASFSFAFGGLFGVMLFILLFALVFGCLNWGNAFVLFWF